MPRPTHDAALAMRKPALSLLLASALFIPAMAWSEGPGVAVNTSRKGQAPGLLTTTFETPQGSLSVYLPDDLRPGDTISGTVELEPAGRTQEERARNAGELRGYVLEIQDRKAPVGDPWWTVAVPASGTTLPIRLLAERRQDPVSRADVPLLAGPAQEAPVRVALPAIVQTGRPIVISGLFDGRLDSSRLTVGGMHAPPVAESPRQAVFRSPVDVVGPVEIRVEEQGEATTGTVRNVALTLSAPRLNLRRGERTTLTVEVRGLEGLDQPIAFEVTNHSPQVVRIKGGDVHRVAISPGAVGSGGTFIWRGSLTGAKSGAFDIQADLDLKVTGR